MGRILITGLAGFIGSNLAKLIDLGQEVVGIDELNELNSAPMKLARLRSLGVSLDKNRHGYLFIHGCYLQQSTLDHF